MRYIVIARDGTDTEAKARRLAARPAHLERVGPFVERGRALHRAGTETGFAPYLDPLAPAEKRRTVDALVVALDVYTWKLLRRDMDRSRHDTETTIRTLVDAILEAMT